MLPTIIINVFVVSNVTVGLLKSNSQYYLEEIVVSVRPCSSATDIINVVDLCYFISLFRICDRQWVGKLECGVCGDHLVVQML